MSRDGRAGTTASRRARGQRGERGTQRRDRAPCNTEPGMCCSTCTG
ncbi:hypothetical protein BURCENBC7_AP4862 [Burkholderia cenocepacia BC7]|nr:hypothetical protein BURCENK562V_C4345 [Burkholderia cenocepacia K56-2Valvano]ERI30533.1 hypothetical protein BURCENBC7_AP4862 [Burkholderia cenocepacia BC7]